MLNSAHRTHAESSMGALAKDVIKFVSSLAMLPGRVASCVMSWLQRAWKASNDADKEVLSRWANLCTILAFFVGVVAFPFGVASAFFSYWALPTSAEKPVSPNAASAALAAAAAAAAAANSASNVEPSAHARESAGRQSLSSPAIARVTIDSSKSLWEFKDGSVSHGERWVEAFNCTYGLKASAVKRRCRDAGKLRPVFDVVVENRSDTPTVLVGVSWVVTGYEPDQGSGPEAALPSVVIPVAATYEVAFNRKFRHREGRGYTPEQWLSTTTDLVPPLSLVKGQPVRFSLLVKDPDLWASSVFWAHIEVKTSDGKTARSETLNLYYAE